MHNINLENARDWGNLNGFYYPRSIADITCSQCFALGTFILWDEFTDSRHNTISATTKCGKCGAIALVWSINAQDPKERKSETCALLMYPAPHQTRKLIDHMELLPPHVRSAYKEAVSTYNNREWNSTATNSRRTLEGLLDDLLPGTESDRLATRIEKIPNTQSDKLFKIFKELSKSVKDEGNIGAHFDRDRVHNEETAEATLNIIEYILEALYTAPGMINTLTARIKRVKKVR